LQLERGLVNKGSMPLIWGEEKLKIELLGKKMKNKVVFLGTGGAATGGKELVSTLISRAEPYARGKGNLKSGRTSLDFAGPRTPLEKKSWIRGRKRASDLP